VSDEASGIQDIQEAILNKVMNKVQPLFSQSDPNDPMAMLIPTLVTAVSMVVGEVMKGVVKELEEKLSAVVVKSPPLPM
jgi:hypothetical protein